MTDGNYYMDGESFIRCKIHFIDGVGTPMILAEEIGFGHGLFYAEHICLVESACDLRMVPSSKEEFELVKNLYLSCHQAIDTLNTGGSCQGGRIRMKTKIIRNLRRNNMESYNSEEHEFDTQKVLDKMKHNECKALIHAITHTLSFFFEIVFVVFITLKITDIIDWSWWIITSPIWGGSIINVCIAIGILIIWRQR